LPVSLFLGSRGFLSVLGNFDYFRYGCPAVLFPAPLILIVALRATRFYELPDII
jgi:hypothetical protein